MLALNYHKIAALPTIVRSFCYSHDAWIVGSGAEYLLDIKELAPRDWDLLIPFWCWGTACKTVPAGTPTNSHGGIKLTENGLSIDLWAGDIGWFLSQVPTYPAYATYPKSPTFLIASQQLKRQKLN
jgi:hypothetical protein